MSGKDTALDRLNAQIEQLTELLSLERSGKVSVEEEMAQLRHRSPSAEGERDRCKGLAEATGSGSRRQAKVSELTGALDAEKAHLRPRAGASRGAQSADRGVTPPARRAAGSARASEQKDKDAQMQIADLGQRLNVALAQRVQELSRYRSDFFGRLRTILGDRPDMHIVGDRFVFQSEVFFDTGQAVLKPEGRTELEMAIAAPRTRKENSGGDRLGAAGRRPYRHAPDHGNSQFKSNWELSAARAISVVQYLISKGVSPQRLVAAGFGEFQPIDPEPPKKPSAATAASS